MHLRPVRPPVGAPEHGGQVVRRWALDQMVAGSNPGRAAMFAFLGKMLDLDCLSPPRRINGYLFGRACKAIAA